jgi:dipeptidyl aminopeptidase/acylaminoacyl peptidase
LQPILPVDAGRAATVSAPLVSPDGRFAVVAIQAPERRADRWRSRLEVVDLDRTAEGAVRLERGAREPRWTGDSELIYLVDMAGRTLIVALASSRFDAPRVVARLDGYAEELAISPDGRRAVVSLSVDRQPSFALSRPVQRGRRRLFIADHRVLRSEDGDLIANRCLEVHLVDLDSGLARALPHPSGTAPGPTEEASGFEPAWFPSGRSVVVALTTGWDETHQLPARARELFRVDLGTGGYEQITDDRRVLFGPAVSPDGHLVAYLRQRGALSAVNYYREVCVLDLAQRTTRSISRAHDLAIDGLAWIPDGAGVLVSYDERGRRRLGRLDLDGGLSDPFDVATDDPPAPSRTGRLGAIEQVAARPGRPVVIETGRGRIRVADPNPWLAKRQLATTTEIAYLSAHRDRREIHAIVARVDGPARPDEMPVIVDLHGGPYDASRWTFDFDREVLAAAGYVVVQPNYRGSRGFGQDFLQLSDRKHYPGWADAPDAPHEMGLDVVGLLDAISSLRLGDPGRVFIRGHSAGALLATWVLGRTGGFRAAVARSWYPGEWSASSAGWYQQRRYFDGPLWETEQVNAFFRRSPMLFAGRITTPLLLIHGEADIVTPLLDVEKYYHLLKNRRLDVALAVFRDEDHDFSRHPSSRRDYLDLELAWFRRHDRGKRAT